MNTDYVLGRSAKVKKSYGTLKLSFLTQDHTGLEISTCFFYSVQFSSDPSQTSQGRCLPWGGGGGVVQDVIFLAIGQVLKKCVALCEILAGKSIGKSKMLNILKTSGRRVDPLTTRLRGLSRWGGGGGGGKFNIAGALSNSVGYYVSLGHRLQFCFDTEILDC